MHFNEQLRIALYKLAQHPTRWPVHRLVNGIAVRKYVFQEKTIILYSEREDFISIDVISDARTDWK